MNYQKFVVFLVSLLMCVAVGVTVYYFMKDEEYIFLQTQEVNVNVGDKFKLDYTHENPLDSTEIKWEIKDKDLLTYDEETGMFTAIAGGTTEIWLDTTRKDWKIQQCYVKIGDGSEENPTIISSGDALKNIGTTGHYILISDIDLQGQNWAPLCSAGAFAGELNGNGHTIKNLTITANAVLGNAGLFGELTYRAYVHDLVLDTVTISGNIENVGAVAGTNCGLIEKVRVVNANLSSLRESTTPLIGGIAGITKANADGALSTELLNYNMFGRIDRCEVSNASLSSSKTAYIGGLTARLDGGFVLNSFFVGNIASAESVSTTGAGIVATMVATSKSNAKLKDNYAVVTFTNVAKKAGVVYQSNFSAYVDGSGKVISENIIWGQYFDANVCNDPSVKAIVSTGYTNESDYNARVNDGKLVASGKSTSFLKMTDEGQDTIYSHTNYKGITFYEKSYNYDFSVTWKIDAQTNNGYPALVMGGKADDAIIAITGDEALEDPTPEIIVDKRSLWQKLADCKEGEEIALAREDSIDWNFGDWEVIGTEDNPFNGTFNGNGATVKNIKIVAGSDYKGLFGVLGSKARITNITFENVKVVGADGFDYVGIVAGYNNGGVISGVTVKNFEIVGGKNVGGVVGYNKGIITETNVINTDSAYKNISINSNAVARVGGIAGLNKLTISDSKCTVELTVQKTDDSDTYVGGIAGENGGIIANSISKSNILAKSNVCRVGGIVGHNTATIAQVAYKGSITAKTDSSNAYVAGIAGFNILNGRIEKSSVQGTFTAYNVAGLVGYNANNETYISQCNVENTTLSGEQVGGFITTMSLGKMENCSVVATAKGLSEKSTKAGFAVVVAGGTDRKSNGNCARIENSFVAVKYEGEGTNWAETTSSIRVSLANSNALKQGGFIKNCIYDSTLAKGAKTQGGSTTIFGNNNSGNYDGNRYDNLDGRTSTEDCYLASTYSKDNRNWDNVNIWTLGSGEYPKVKTAKTID